MTDTARKAPIFSEQTIESALGRLETIVSEIETNPPNLEDLIERYEEGMSLLKACREKLDSAEKRVEIIRRHAGGKECLEPFEDQ
jgi:exodeoxyribonuclease VII small subunit